MGCSGLILRLLMSVLFKRRPNGCLNCRGAYDNLKVVYFYGGGGLVLRLLKSILLEQQPNGCSFWSGVRVVEGDGFENH